MSKIAECAFQKRKGSCRGCRYNLVPAAGDGGCRLSRPYRREREPETVFTTKAEKPAGMTAGAEERGEMDADTTTVESPPGACH